jgi:hypothetical protein
MARPLYLSFANLTCRFGDDLVLMDLIEEIVIPALFNENFERRHGFSSFFFRDIGFADVAVEGTEETQLTIYGRFIKNTLLMRTQTYSREHGLVTDEAAIESAPSAFFALDLNNHKLMFLPETPFAPTLSNFAATLQTLLRQQHDTFIRALHAVSADSVEPLSYRQIREKFPRPNVTVTPLASEGNVASFIATFYKLERVEFQFLSTNAEIQQDQNFRMIRAMKDGVHAEKTKLVHENKKGLDKDAVTEEATAAALGGNQKVLLRGSGEDGAIMRGSNDNLKLQVVVTDPPESLFARAVFAVQSYATQVLSGRLKPDVSTPPTEKLAIVREKLGGRIERG